MVTNTMNTNGSAPLKMSVSFTYGGATPLR